MQWLFCCDLVNPMADESDWKAVDQYAQKRRDDHADVFGWFRVEDVAVMLVAESSQAATFPKEIAGIRVHIKKVTAPEKLA